MKTKLHTVIFEHAKNKEKCNTFTVNYTKKTGYLNGFLNEKIELKRTFVCGLLLATIIYQATAMIKKINIYIVLKINFYIELKT